MTTTPQLSAPPDPTAVAQRNRLPLQGISHIGLTVDDVPAAISFWTEVMGFELGLDSPSSSLLLHREARIALGLTDHAGAAQGPFDHRHVGLDHLALAVAGPAELSRWATQLTEHGVDHSGITESDAGQHINLKAPGGLAVELFVIGAEFIGLLGLTSSDAAVAGTHGVNPARADEG